MTRFSALGASTALYLFLPAAAQADITPAEVWAEIQELSQSYGQTIEAGSQSEDGGNLTLNDITWSMSVPEMDMTGSIAQLFLQDRGDGTVGITVSPEYLLSISASPEEGEAADIDLAVRHSGLAIVAAREGDVSSYDYLAESLAIVLDSVTVEGEEVPAEFEVALANFNGQYDFTRSDVLAIDSKSSAEGVTVTLRAEDEEEGNVALDLSFTNLTASSAGSVPADADLSDENVLIDNPFDFMGEFSHEGMEFNLAGSGDGDSFAASGSSAGGGISMSMDNAALSYEAGTEGLNLIVSGSDIPLPQVGLRMAEAGWGLEMPLAAADGPQPFSFGLLLGGLEVDDMIWGMVDQGGVLPRDPATISLDLSGAAIVLANLLDPNIEDSMAMEPAEVQSLTINGLEVSAAGASLTGNGEFTFDYDQPSPLGQGPKPVGGVSLQVVGVNGLLDNLVAMGLLPEDQAMGARMMLGLFARPGDGEDTLVSEIEINEEGAILANGQRIQ